MYAIFTCCSVWLANDQSRTLYQDVTGKLSSSIPVFHMRMAACFLPCPFIIPLSLLGNQKKNVGSKRRLSVHFTLINGMYLS